HPRIWTARRCFAGVFGLMLVLGVTAHGRAQEGTAASDATNLLLVQVHGKSGYINLQGKMVIAPTFNFAWGFSEGLASVWTGDPNNSRAGYIDGEGKFIITPRFLYARAFHEGLAAVELNIGEWAFVNKAGAY